MKKTKRLFHYTKPHHIDSILKYGLQPSPWEGLIYFSNSLKGTAQFAQFGTTEGVRDENDPNKVVGFRIFPQLYILEISTELFDWNHVGYGTDHNPMFFQEIEVYVYNKSIPPESIIDIWEYHVEDGNIQHYGLYIPPDNSYIRYFPKDW